MKFRATKEQLLQIGTHAVRASGVFGMGFLRGNGTEDFTLKEDENSHDSGLGEKALSTRGLHLDYVLGRMVKLYIQACGEGIYQMHAQPRHDYQSWVTTYPTNEALVKSVPGVEVIES